MEWLDRAELERLHARLGAPVAKVEAGVPTLCATSQNELPMHNAHAQFPTTLGNPLSEDPPINLSYPV